VYRVQITVINANQGPWYHRYPVLNSQPEMEIFLAFNPDHFDAIEYAFISTPEAFLGTFVALSGVDCQHEYRLTRFEPSYDISIFSTLSPGATFSGPPLCTAWLVPLTMEDFSG
jgi:hypothetical protein